MQLDPTFASYSRIFNLLLIHSLLNVASVVQKPEGEEHKELIYPPDTDTDKADVIIGVLLSIHKEDCKELRPQYGIQRAEMAVETIKHINNNLLDGLFKIRLEIRDTCWKERVAVESTIEFLKHVIGSDCNGTSKDSNNDAQLVAVIGPGSSDSSKAVQNLLQIFSIPQVGYSATSSDLSDVNAFKYFMRVVPSDKHQASALVDIVKHFNWTYVGLVYSEGNYGEKGASELKKRFEQESNHCNAPGFELEIKTEHNEEKMDSLVLDLKQKATSNGQATIQTIICFCLYDHVHSLFKAIRKYNMGSINDTLKFQWIGTESWADQPKVVEGVEDVAIGGISLRIPSKTPESFSKFFNARKPKRDENDEYNPWFNTFWEHKNNCSLKGLGGDSCRQKTFPDDVLVSDTKLEKVEDCLYVVALGLKAMFNDLCPGHSGGLCKKMKHINGSTLFSKYMLKIDIESKTYMKNETDKAKLFFEDNGDPAATYDIINYQKFNDSTKTGYFKVGTWTNKNTTEGNRIIMTNKVQFHNKEWNGTNKVIKSECKQCASGNKKVYPNSGQKCCWDCEPCGRNQFVSDEVNCTSCLLVESPNTFRNGCTELVEEYVRYDDPGAIVALTISGLGIIIAIFVSVVFIKHNNTPMVKSTTRELSYIILIGLLLCFASTLMILHRPTEVTCYLTRIVPAIGFSMVYGALLTRTNRIARIVGSNKIETKPRLFLAAKDQVIITCVIVLIEVGIIVAILLKEPPDSSHHVIDNDSSTSKRIILQCNTSPLGILAPYGFNFFLIGMCTIYAVKTRNLPANFNEAKFIGFTMYTTCIIWLAFIAIYFGSNRKSLTMCFCFSLCAYVSLFLLFFPKLYIILLKPEDNDRSKFVTLKETNIKVHIPKSQNRSTTRYNNSKSVTSSGTQRTKSRRWNKESIHVPNPAKTLHPKVSTVSETVVTSPEVSEVVQEKQIDRSLSMRSHKQFPLSNPKLSIITESSVSNSQDNENSLASQLSQATKSSRSTKSKSSMESQSQREEYITVMETAVQTDFDLVDSWFRSMQHERFEKTNTLRRRFRSIKERTSGIADKFGSIDSSSKLSRIRNLSVKQRVEDKKSFETRVQHYRYSTQPGTIAESSPSGSPLISRRDTTPAVNYDFNEQEESHDIISTIAERRSSTASIASTSSTPEVILISPIHTRRESQSHIHNAITPSIFTSTLTHSLQTVVGSALVLGTGDNEFTIEVEEVNKHPHHDTYTLKHGIESAMPPLCTLGGPVSYPSYEQANTPSEDGSLGAESPNGDSKNSLLNKLSYSIRKKMKRNHPLDKRVSPINEDLSPADKCTPTADHDTEIEPNLNGSQLKQRVVSSRIEESIPEELLSFENFEPKNVWNNQERREFQSSIRSNHPQLLSRNESMESDAADSGFMSARPSDKMTSFDSQFSSRFGSGRSRHGSQKNTNHIHRDLQPCIEQILAKEMLIVPIQGCDNNYGQEMKSTNRVEESNVNNGAAWIALQEDLNSMGVNLTVESDTAFV